MTISVKKIALTEQQSPATHQPLTENYSGLVGAVEVECQVRLGTIKMTIAELRQLKEEQVLPLLQKTNEPIDIILHEQVIARGDLVAVEGYFAVQITEVAS